MTSTLLVFVVCTYDQYGQFPLSKVAERVKPSRYLFNFLILTFKVGSRAERVKHPGRPIEKGTWRIGRPPDCLASHACVPGSNPADPA